MNKHNSSLTKRLPALLTLAGGMFLGGAKSAPAANVTTVPGQPLEDRIKKIAEALNIPPSAPDNGGVQTGQAATPMFFPWPNWANGVWRNWPNWHNGWGNGWPNWHNGLWHNWHNWHNY